LIDPSNVLLYGLLGTVMGAALSWLPGLHIFNILALLLSIGFTGFIPDQYFPFFALGAVIAYSYLYAIPTVYFSVAEESTIFMLFPTQRYLLNGRGHEAVLLYLIGSLFGSLFLILGSVVLLYLVPIMYNIFMPFITYLIIGIVVFWFMAEWPRKGDRGTPRERFINSYAQILGGLFIFFAAGILGFVVNYTGILPAEMAYARLTPLFIGFFGMPWVLQNILLKRKIPKQVVSDSVETSLTRVGHAFSGGLIGGLIAAVFPIITGGMGALIASHMTSQRGDDAFIISQGVNRVIYYVGAFYLLFLPTARLTRGAVAWLTQGIYVPKTWSEFYYAIFVITLASGVSLLLTLFASKLLARNLHRVNYTYTSILIAIYLVIITYLITGLIGVALMLFSTLIGLATILLNTRRSYPLAALIFPVLASMTGTVDFWLKIIGLR